MSSELYLSVNWVVVIAYVVATVANAVGIFFDKEPYQRRGHQLAGAGLLLHAAIIAVRWQEVGHGPYLAPSEVLSSDSWVMLACFFAFHKFYPRIRQTSLVVFPAAFLMLALSMFYNPAIRTLPPTFRSVWLVVHVGLYKISLATLVISCAFSVIYLLKKRHDRGWLLRFPPLEILDVYSYRFAGFGFVFWVIGMLAGSIWAYQSWGRFWGWDPTETWALITSVLFGVYLHLRRFFQWKGTPAAWFLTGCFVVSLVSFFGIATSVASIHGEYFR